MDLFLLSPRLERESLGMDVCGSCVVECGRCRGQIGVIIRRWGKLARLRIVLKYEFDLVESETSIYANKQNINCARDEI